MVGCDDAGTWTCYWGYTYGLEKSNNFGFSDCHDLHAGWRIFCTGKQTYLFLYGTQNNSLPYILGTSEQIDLVN